MEEDKPSSPDIHVGSASDIEMGKDIHVGSASDIEMGKDIHVRRAKCISHELYTEVQLMFFKQDSSESRSSECCIYTVPQSLRNVNCEAYTPLLIPIGPLHRENTEDMEKEKLKYFKKLTEREGMDEMKICGIVSSIMNKEERLRHCYPEKSTLKVSSYGFAKMILLDAVFIIEFFLESNDKEGPKIFKPRMTFDIRQDLMLFENQLPLFIIEEIYDKAMYPYSDNKHKSFLDLATYYLREYFHLQVVETSPGVEKETSPAVEKETSPGVKRRHQPGCTDLMLCKTSLGAKKQTSQDEKKRHRHLTDLLRNLMLNRAIKRSYSLDPVKLKYSAVMLRKAGVRFQATRDECLVNIKFDKGVLKIPHLKVDHNFNRLIRNIMAMEQCLYEREADICSYIKFMDHLIDSAGDVGLLVENGIILHWLGDDAAVSNMINNLCKNIGDQDSCFGDISKELNAHYENPWNHRKATLKLVYFPNIWRGTGTVAAAILLILTLIQTIKTFL